uniref:CRC domain-containing protein n=1 Tax=Mantoniella antarctica TaxID=81844 RepID=A0A7S0X557_9CHLO|mmetsp:Transcript_19636/g.48601  ORF Transcript_19636/g.48601 Transcript_19636/m.48601 type:complete len:378 (+) Transcript_19636:67-1200(+)
MPVRKKNCNCRNSRCLKLYCECFASGLHCERCNCTNCCNNLENAAIRQEAVEATLERNPNAFRPKIAPTAGAEVEAEGVGRHNKGCHCKKSSCLKKYCECFQANIFCSDICRCVECKNFEGSSQYALTAAKIARQPLPPSVAVSPRRNAAGARDATGLPFRGKASTDDHRLRLGGNDTSLASPNVPEGLTWNASAPQSRLDLAAAGARQSHAHIDQVVSKTNVDDLSRSLLAVSDTVKQKNLQQTSSVAPGSRAHRATLKSPTRQTQAAVESQRMRGSLGREAKAHKTEEELSVEEKALLCDEGDNLFSQTSSQARRAAAHDSKEALKLRKPKPGKASLMEREGSVILDLTRNIQNISASCKRRRGIVDDPSGGDEL